MKRTYQPSKIRRARTHGFLVRMKTRGGRAVINARRAKGRKRLAVSSQAAGISSTCTFWHCWYADRFWHYRAATEDAAAVSSSVGGVDALPNSALCLALLCLGSSDGGTAQSGSICFISGSRGLAWRHGP